VQKSNLATDQVAGWERIASLAQHLFYKVTLFPPFRKLRRETG
jgi:hypothetical protein